MDSLKDILYQTMQTYAGEAINGYSYLTRDKNEQIFTIISIGHYKGKQIVDTGLVAKIVDDHIVIERDVNDKLLVDALVQNGVPREQIILAYAGEKPERAKPI